MGCELIWTPPYLPTVQPIELCWAHCKSYVASHFFTSGSIEQTLQALYDAFYGNKAGKKGYDAELAQKHIKHAHAFCNSYIADDAILTDTIDNLSGAPASTSSPSSSSSSSTSQAQPPAPEATCERSDSDEPLVAGI